MLRSAALFAALLMMSDASAQTGRVSVEPTVMIVELPAGARYVGLPKVCPGDDETTDTSESICTAELYEGRAQVIRHISGPRARSGLRLRFTSHALRTRRPLALLVVTVPFEDAGVSGNFAPWWLLPEEDGSYCLELTDVERMEDGPVRRAFEAGRPRRFRAQGNVAKADFRCLYP